MYLFQPQVYTAQATADDAGQIFDPSLKKKKKKKKTPFDPSAFEDGTTADVAQAENGIEKEDAEKENREDKDEALQREIEQCEVFVVLFDESANDCLQSKQMDVHVRCWDFRSESDDDVYYTSVFLGILQLMTSRRSC
ncbi:hypothetical protein HPB48_014968 [Haemaphysalis longicornis]|uniref:Uncharacterized protein n=1 Tax=Haemaphysalis longicornis TaxID=44386 RepID=A0A9J6FGD4_HAELO|nr:hypothetical protein HPB48_014968 [Haemaphysalis longicornis]